MPDAKISSLTSLTGAAVDAAADLLPIVDVSATTAGSKKITVNELKTAFALGGAASLNVGTTAGTVAAGDDSRFGRVDFLRFDAADFIPRTTNGCGVDSTETATNLINRDLLLFDAATAEFAQVWFLWPDGWNTATATFFWHGNGTADVVWSARLAVFSDGDAIDSAFGTAQTVTDSAASANTHRQSAATPAITPSGTVGARKRAVLGISRDATNGSDTLAVDACLSGVLLERAS